jgi:hypothetical protein
VKGALVAVVVDHLQIADAQLELLLQLAPDCGLRILARIQMPPGQSPAGIVATSCSGMDHEEMAIPVGEQAASGTDAARAGAEERHVLDILVSEGMSGFGPEAIVAPSPSRPPTS